MQEVFFFFSIQDISVALEALRLGNLLVVNGRYRLDEELIVLMGSSNVPLDIFHRFFVIPDSKYLSELFLCEGVREDGTEFRYIMDRIGAAAVKLTLYDTPLEGAVCVGSLGFQARTYSSPDGPLDPRPIIFSNTFRDIRSFIKKNAQPVPSGNTPKTVYVFPKALDILQKDFSRSPWKSLQICRSTIR